MSCRSFSLLIRVVIHQNVHLDELVPKMIVSIFFPKSFEGQRSKDNSIKMDGACI